MSEFEFNNKIITFHCFSFMKIIFNCAKDKCGDISERVISKFVAISCKTYGR